ncbi:MAG: hypothetical protein ACR2QQ_14825 [Gammaproteobacteria bacterium]
MEVLRISRDVWGQEVVQGLSWDLLPAFFFAAFALIALHALYRWFLAPRR